MRRLLWVLIASVVVIGLCVGAGFAAGSENQARAQWVAVRLPGSSPGANAINNRGQAVGSSEIMSGFSHAALWESGKLRDLGTLPGGQESSALDINERGQVVGWSQAKNGIAHAFLWEKGKMRDLGTIPGPHPDSMATAINERGQVVGGTNWPSGHSRAWLWEKGKMRDLGTLAGASESAASGINDLGQIVGWTDTKGVFLYENGRMRSLGFDSNRGAAAINNRGQVLGIAVVWRADHLTRLPADFQGWGINDRGQIVGAVFRGDGPRAALLQSSRIIRLPNGRSTYANDINERNQIVGYAGMREVEPHWATLWTLKRD